MICLVSGTGIIEKRETSQPQIIQYFIKVGKRFQVNFELPATISALEGGQKVTITLSTSRPKKTRSLLILRGEVYQIEKTKTGTSYFIFFSGLEGSITSKKTLSGIRAKKPIYLTIST